MGMGLGRHQLTINLIHPGKSTAGTSNWTKPPFWGFKMLPSLKLTAKAPENEWLEYFLVSFLGQKAYPLNELERFANTKQHRVVGLRSVLHGRRIAWKCNISSKFILPALLDIQYLSPWNWVRSHLHCPSSTTSIIQSLNKFHFHGQETHERVLALNMGLPPSIASFTWAGVGRHNDLEIWELLVRTSFANKAPSNEKIWLVVSTPLKKYESKWESSPNRDGHKKYLSCHHLEIHLGNFQGCNLFSYITNHQIVPHPRLPVTMSFVCFLWCLVFCGSNNNWELTQIERNQVENIIKQTWKKTRGDDSANWINQTELTKQFLISHTIHVWYIYPHWP